MTNQAVTVTRTRVSLATKLNEWADRNGRTYSAATTGGRLRYMIDGVPLESEALMRIMNGEAVGEVVT
jgi:hypothetical protein